MLNRSISKSCQILSAHVSIHTHAHAHFNKYDIKIKTSKRNLKIPFNSLHFGWLVILLKAKNVEARQKIKKRNIS